MIDPNSKLPEQLESEDVLEWFYDSLTEEEMLELVKGNYDQD